MPRLMIKCPATGTSVPVGMSFGQQAFDSAHLSQNSFGPCAACGGMHTWDKEDAFLESSPASAKQDESDAK